jgi:molecular chaperone GrpE (heat shock protein)
MNEIEMDSQAQQDKASGLLASAVTELLRRESAAEQAVRYLSTELDQVKRLSQTLHIRPLLLDLLRIADRLEAELAFQPQLELESFHAELMEALGRVEVSVICVTPERFAPETQKVVQTKLTSIEAEHGKVLQVTRKGYLHQSKVLRPEEVVIARYEASRVSES